MKRICHLIITVFITIILAPSTALANKDNLNIKDFWHPKYLGERLAYCKLDKSQCGQSVADCYCKKLGYEFAKHFTIANNVGLTHYINTRARCQGWQCNGFMDIGCARELKHKPAAEYYYSLKKFNFPRYANYRVDWCYNDKNCGFKAAKAFCRMLGYMNTKTYRKDSSVNASRTLGSEKLCFGKDCNGFEYIICRR